MAIRVGETGGLGPPFRKRKTVRNPYSEFRTTPPFDPRKGHVAPLVPEQFPGDRLPLFTVIGEKDDYVLCTGYDPYDEVEFTEDEPVAVAKPFLLQRTPFHGNTIEFRDMTVGYSYSGEIGTRVATAVVDGEEVTENQRITPDYFLNDVIVVARVRFKSGDHTGIEDENGDLIEWVDMNHSGRAWAEELG